MYAKLKGKLKSTRWLDDNAAKYLDGKNPWLDVFTKEITNDLADIISITNCEEKTHLRLKLSGTAEYIHQTYNQIQGGPAAPGKKAKWVNDVTRAATRTKGLLEDSSAYHSGMAERHSKPTVMTIYSASVMTDAVDDAEKAISNLLILLQKFRYLKEESGKYPTLHSRYLQIAVDGVTEVFGEFRGLENIKRASDSEGVYGEYPDFVRKAADRILSAYYPNFEGQPQVTEKLDRQIQEATKEFKKRRNE